MGKSQFILWDNNGELLTKHKAEGDTATIEVFLTSDDDLIRSVFDRNGYEFFWVNTTEKRME